MNDNKSKFAGYFKFEKCTITSFNGSEINIIPMIFNIDIFEDLYSPFLTIELTLLDNTGLYSKLPFRGEEIVTMTIKDPSGAGLEERQFFIYKMKDLVNTERTYSYTLCLISIEAVVDLSIKLSKAYKGTPSDIAKEIISKDVLQTDKQLTFEQTKNSISFIANYWSPLQTMKFLCERAVSKNGGSPTYMFYETKSGFKFISMNALSQQDSLHEFNNSDKLNNDTKKSFERIINLYIDEPFDYIDRIKKGAYGNRILLVNPLSKSYMYRNYDFTKANEDFSRMNTGSTFTDSSTRRLNSSFHVRTAPTSTYAGMMSENTLEWFQQRKVDLSIRTSQRIEIEVPGRFNISVGDVANIYIYKEAPQETDSGSKDAYEILDKQHSGRYMITSIRHTLDTNEHVMVLELSKDSLLSDSATDR